MAWFDIYPTQNILWILFGIACVHWSKAFYWACYSSSSSLNTCLCFSPSVHVSVYLWVCLCVQTVQRGPVNSVSLMARRFVSIQEPLKPIIKTSVINPRFIVYLGLDRPTDRSVLKRIEAIWWGSNIEGFSNEITYKSKVAVLLLCSHVVYYYVSRFVLLLNPSPVSTTRHLFDLAKTAQCWVKTSKYQKNGKLWRKHMASHVSFYSTQQCALNRLCMVKR